MFDKIKKLLGHTLVYGLGSSGTRFIGFLLIPLYTRYLTPEDYGVLALVALLGQILFTLMSMGQGTAVFRTYFAHDDQQHRDVVVTTSLWLIVTLAFPACLVVLALTRPLTQLLTGNPNYWLWVMLGVLGVLFKIVLRLPFAVLRARGESKRYASWSFMQTATALILAVAFVAGFHMGGRGVLLSQLLAELLLCVYLLPATLKGLPLRFSRGDAKDLVGYGLYQIPTALFGFLLHMADRYFLKHYASLQAVGLYSLGYRFGEIVYFAVWAFALAWQPFLFEHRKSAGAPVMYARVCTYVTAVLAFLWLGVSVLAPETIAIMARPAFHEAHRVVPWIAGAFFFQGLVYVAAVGIVFHRKVKYRPLILGVATVLNIGLNFALVPRYEMIGAAIAGCVSFFVWFLAQVLVSHRLYPIPYEYARLARVVLTAGMLYALGSMIAWSSIWTAVGGKLLLVLCFPLLLYATGFFHAGELARLRQSLSSVRRMPAAFLQARGASK